MVIFGREKGGNDHISVGMRNPNGEYERPITGERLFWTKPGRKILIRSFGQSGKRKRTRKQSKGEKHEQIGLLTHRKEDKQAQTETKQTV